MTRRTARLPRSPYGPGTHVVEFDAPAYEPAHGMPGSAGGWVRIKGPWPESTCVSYVASQRRFWRGMPQAECYRVVRYEVE